MAEIDTPRNDELTLNRMKRAAAMAIEVDEDPSEYYVALGEQIYRAVQYTSTDEEFPARTATFTFYFDAKKCKLDLGVIDPADFPHKTARLQSRRKLENGIPVLVSEDFTPLYSCRISTGDKSLDITAFHDNAPHGEKPDFIMGHASERPLDGRTFYDQDLCKFEELATSLRI